MQLNWKPDSVKIYVRHDDYQWNDGDIFGYKFYERHEEEEE